MADVVDRAAIATFQETVWDYYRQHGRHDLPWRSVGDDGQVDAYHVLVSELMLQQTQVPRVIGKFAAFLQAFPTITTLAQAPLAAVLTAWSGLGYNRRAKFLWQAARAIVAQHHGRVPATMSALVALPGIGPNTAGAIMAYAHNQPVVFIETNIRTVFIHHFFTVEPVVGKAADGAVTDKQLLPFIVASVPAHEVRDWYWALMDYGTSLKKQVGNVARASANYKRQSAFQGSRRQIRGAVLRALAAQDSSKAVLAAALPDERLPEVLQALQKEGLIVAENGHFRLAT